MSPTPDPDGTLPPELVERVWAYLAAFLPPAAIDGAVDEVAADATYWGDTDDVEVMKVAHTVLASRMRIAADVEALVLNEDAGLTVDEVGHVLDLPPHRVRQMLDEALAVLADPDALDAVSPLEGGDASGSAAAAVEEEDDTARLADRIGAEREVPGATERAPLRFDDTAAEPATTPASPTATPSPAKAGIGGLSWRVIGIGAAIVLAALLAILLGGDGGEAEPGAAVDPCPATAPICVTEAVVTDEVDSLGEPAPARETFTLDDTVRLWLSYERRQPGDVALALLWVRDGTQLYETDFTLPANDRVTVTLARLFMDQPGMYAVEVRAGDDVLVRREFTVAEA